jgi:hypothetical protein
MSFKLLFLSSLSFILLSLDSDIYKILFKHESGKYKNIAKLIRKTKNINAQDKNDYGRSALHIGKY